MHPSAPAPTATNPVHFLSLQGWALPALVVGILSPWLTGAETPAVAPKPNAAVQVNDSAAHQATPIKAAIQEFTQEGKKYRIIDGRIYEVSTDGSQKFVLQAYDPKFREKSYVVRKDGTFLKQDGQLVKTQQAFADDFEGVARMESLLAEDRWHHTNADPRNSGKPMDYSAAGCVLSIAQDIKHTGKGALKCFVPACPGKILKCSIYRGLFFYSDGDDVHFSGWYYLDADKNLGDATTLLDIESTYIEQSCGIRLIFRGRALAGELKWGGKPQFRQPAGKEVPFPLKQWVHLTGKIHLQADAEGRLELWQDGNKILDQKGQTLPFKGAVYDRVETGLSAVNNALKDTTLYVDDFAIGPQPLKSNSTPTAPSAPVQK